MRSYALAATFFGVLTAIATSCDPALAQINPAISLQVKPPQIDSLADTLRKAMEIKKLQIEIEAKQQEMQLRAMRATAPIPPTADVRPDVPEQRAAMPGGSLESVIRQCDMDRPVTAVNAMEVGQCSGYIRGVVDTFSMLSDQFKDTPMAVCLPPAGISGNQTMKIVQKWATDHPEWLHESAEVHIALSLIQAFPCPKK